MQDRCWTRKSRLLFYDDCDKNDDDGEYYLSYFNEDEG